MTRADTELNADEIQQIAEVESAANGDYFAQDEAFCARMREAIEAGLENAPIGVVTTPGTKKPEVRASRALSASLLTARCGARLALDAPKTQRQGLPLPEPLPSGLPSSLARVSAWPFLPQQTWMSCAACRV